MRALLAGLGRFSLCFTLGATLLGSDCRVGRQVVDELPELAESGACQSQPCELDHEPEFEMPVFAEASVCPSELCPAMPLEGLASNSAATAVHLSYAVDVFTEITLSRVSLTNVVLELSGPVSLRIVGGSTLFNVFVVMSKRALWRASEESNAPGQQGAPRLLLEESSLRQLTVRGSSEGAAVGEVELVRDMVESLDLTAESISIHSSEVSGARFESNQLEIVDVTLNRAVMSFDDGFWASVKGANLRTQNCGNLATALTSIAGDASEIGPCQSLRLQSSSMTSGMLDGDVHAEDSRFMAVFFGKRVPSTFDSWNGSLERIRFCEQTGLMRLHKSNTIFCSSCEGATALSACSMDGAPDVRRNPCELLQQDLPVCTGPWPVPAYPL